MKFPDKEALRQMQEFRRLMPTTEQQRMIDEIREASSNPMRDAVMRQHLQFKELYGNQVALVASGLVSAQMPDILKGISASMVEFQTNNAQLLIDAARAIGQLSKAIPYDVIKTIGSTLAQFDKGPAWAAFETMRQLGFDNVSPDFSEFAEETLATPGKLEKKRVKKITKAYVAKKKRKGLTKKEYETLMLWIQIFTLIFTFYAATKTQTPPQYYFIDQHSESQIKETKYYIVVRPCPVKAKNNSKSAIIGKLRKNQRVEEVYDFHKWLYLIYIDDRKVDPQYGWVMKKHLTVDKSKKVNKKGP